MEEAAKAAWDTNWKKSAVLIAQTFLFAALAKVPKCLTATLARIGVSGKEAVSCTSLVRLRLGFVFMGLSPKAKPSTNTRSACFYCQKTAAPLNHLEICVAHAHLHQSIAWQFEQRGFDLPFDDWERAQVIFSNGAQMIQERVHYGAATEARLQQAQANVEA